MRFSDLQKAIADRQKEWVMSVPVPISFYACELAGEVGEACNLIKKLERARLGLRGSKASIGDLADELADTMIVVGLIANELNIDLGAAVGRKFNWTSEKYGFLTRISNVPDRQKEAADG